MHVVRESKSPTNTRLVINATTEDLVPIKNHVLIHFKKTVKVPGFRAGKAPLSLVEKNIDQRAFLDEFMQHALNELYRQAVTNEHLRPVTQPQVEVKKFVPFSTLEFEAEVETIGQVKLADYKAIKLSKPKVVVSAKDVNDVLADLQTRSAERNTVDRPARVGDEVIIDFDGKDQTGKPINGASGKDYSLILGSKTFIPDFEDHLVGAGAGKAEEFNVIFPDDYGVRALQKKKVTFSVNVKKVQELKKPKLDDEFAKKAGPFKSLTELKADIKKQLKTEKEREAHQRYENELIQKLVEKSSVEIPQVLIDEQIQQLEDEEKRNLVYRGQTWQEHLEEEGVTEQQHRERQRPDAELSVKAGLVLSEIAGQEQLSVQPEELKIRTEMLKGQYRDPAMQAELEKAENQQDIAARLLTEKTISRLVEYASS